MNPPDLAVVVLDRAGNELRKTTIDLGGFDEAFGLAMDPAGNAYLGAVGARLPTRLSSKDTTMPCAYALS